MCFSLQKFCRPKHKQVLEVIQRIAEEFSFPIEQLIIAEHTKQRVTADSVDRHWHILVEETDPADGKHVANQQLIEKP